MAQKIDTWQPWTTVDAMQRQLQTIKAENGYDCSPSFSMTWVDPKEIPASELPRVCLEFDDWEPEKSLERGYGGSRGIERFAWTMSIWGMVGGDNMNERDIMRAKLMIQRDLMSCLWGNERLVEHGTAKGGLAIRLVGVDYDGGALHADRRGFVLITAETIISLQRGGTP